MTNEHMERMDYMTDRPQGTLLGVAQHIACTPDAHGHIDNDAYNLVLGLTDGMPNEWWTENQGGHGPVSERATKKGNRQ